MTAVGKGSRGGNQLFTQSEATAGQATCLFHLALTADQADGTGLVPVVTLSKAGAAFAAAAGVVTELTNGWYKIVLTAVDLNTLGALGMRVAVATADTLELFHQVIALDVNVATVNPGADGITAATIAADAGAELRTGVATAAAVAALTTGQSTASVSLGLRTTDGNFTAKSMLNAIKTVISVTGVWNGATVTAQVCADPAAMVPAWTDIGTPLTADGTIEIAGPHSAFRAVLSNDGASTSLTATAAIVHSV